jgi:ATP synthase protein I
MRENSKMISMALRVSTDFSSAVAIGAFLGYGLDRYLKTQPWGMVILIVLGIMAGGLNVYRNLRQMTGMDENK